MIDQDQGMCVMHTGIAMAYAFPSSPFNQPGGRQFHLRTAVWKWRGRVGREPRESVLQCERLLAPDDGITKKTAGITQSGWVRETAFADRDHGLGNFLRACVLSERSQALRHTAGLDFGSQVAIVNLTGASQGFA